MTRRAGCDRDPARAVDTLRNCCWRRSQSDDPDRAFVILGLRTKSAGRSPDHNSVCFRCDLPSHRTRPPSLESSMPAASGWRPGACRPGVARGMARWPSATTPEGGVWVLDNEVAGVIGRTVVQRQGPSWGGRTKSVRSRLCICRGRSPTRPRRLVGPDRLTCPFRKLVVGSGCRRCGEVARQLDARVTSAGKPGRRHR
jgi:hypothetical protein